MSDSPRSERHIVVELISGADVARLEARDDATNEKLKALDKRIEGLHRTVYELIEAISNNPRR